MREVLIMICPVCKADVPDGNKFCPTCGASLAAVEAVSEAVSEVSDKVEEAAAPVEEAVAETSETISSEIPNATFDPGEPIAIPKKKEEAPLDIPSVEAPVAPAPIPAPIAEPIPEPVAAPIPAPVASPISLTPETVPSAKSSFSAPAAVPMAVDERNESKAMSTGTAFWLLLLFSIPVVGLICSIILSFAGKKCKSRKNFARAVLIWQIIAIIAALALVIVTYFLAQDVFEAAMSGDFTEFTEALQDLFGI